MTLAMKPQAETSVPTRYSLLSRLQNWDDADSWKEFFDTYWRLIYSIASKSGLNESEAQDAVQETIISVARDLPKFKRDRQLGSFKGWLRNIIRWRIADQLRKRRPETHLTQFTENEVARLTSFAAIVDAAAPDSEELWEREWQTNLLKAAMDRIRDRVKEEHFQIFDLYAVRHWPVTKVARTLGVSIGQVYLIKHRVAALIKREVRELEAKWQQE